MFLETIEKANDIKHVGRENWEALAQEIREFLIQKISVTGGHLGSNLGAVELTMALHLALELPEDKIIWDVGHQSYTHKILTGRKDGFETPRHNMDRTDRRSGARHDRISPLLQSLRCRGADHRPDNIARKARTYIQDL